MLKCINKGEEEMYISKPVVFVLQNLKSISTIVADEYRNSAYFWNCSQNVSYVYVKPESSDTFTFVVAILQ